MGEIFDTWKDIFEFVSYLATIVGVIGLFFAMKSYKKSILDSSKAEQSRLMDNSIELLRVFSTNLLPQIEKYESEWPGLSEDTKKRLIEKAQISNKDTNALPDEIIIKIDVKAKTELGVLNIFNQLEQVCAYISHDLIIEDVVYPTLHKVFFDFIYGSSDVLKQITSDEVPYMNIHMVMKKWSDMDVNGGQIVYKIPKYVKIYKVIAKEILMSEAMIKSMLEEINKEIDINIAKSKADAWKDNAFIKQ